MIPRHHATDELLLAYAAGSLGEAQSLAVGTHLALCPACRAEVRRLEALGGTLLQAVAGESADDALLADLLGRLDAPDGPPAPAPGPCGSAPAGPISALPQPLRGYVAGGLDAAPWIGVLPGVEQAVVPVGSGTARAWLLRLGPGAGLPRQGQAGMELTLVLAGGYMDGGRHLGRGDMDVSDPAVAPAAVAHAAVAHAAMADGDGGCVVLIVTDAPLRLPGTLLRL